MLRSTLEAILPQLDTIADHLGIDQCDRNAFFKADPDSLGQVLVSIGEINVGTHHTLRFDVGGKLLEAWQSHWDLELGDINQFPLTEEQVQELALL